MIVLLLLSAGVCLLILRRVYKNLWSRNLSFRLDFDSPAVYAGGTAGILEVVENRKRLPVPLLEVCFRIQKGIQLPGVENVLTSDYIYKRDLFSLMGMESVTRTYKAGCPRRGCYSFSQMPLTCRSLLLGSAYTCDSGSDKNLYVYAARTDVSDIMPVFESLFGEFQSSRKYYEDPFAFSGIRDYTLQDPMKTINWKASARTGSLMVNTFSSVLSSQIMIYLDVSDRFLLKKDEQLEECISVAATMAARLLGDGMEVGLSVNTPDGFYLPPAGGRRQLKAVEQFLTADFSAMQLSAFEGSLREMPEGTPFFPVFLSINADEELKENILGFLGREKQGLLIVPVESDSALPIVGAENLTIIKKLKKYY